MGLAGKRNEFVDGIRDNVVVLEVKLRSCVYNHIYTNPDRLADKMSPRTS